MIIFAWFLSLYKGRTDNDINQLIFKIMNKGIKILTAAVVGLAAVACSSPKKMAEQAENVVVKSDPAVLEVVAGKINADVTVTYPEKYFHPKAVLEVTPVIVYEGGEAKMEPYYFQGEKVKDNYEVVSADGATVTKPVSFEYAPGMEKCYLELRGVVKFGDKTTELPTKKVADGANTTYMLVCKNGKVDYKADAYQEIIKQTAEGQVLYTINSSVVRNNQLKGESVKNFLAALDEIKAFCAAEHIGLNAYVDQFDDSDISGYLNEILIQMLKTVDAGLNASGILPGRLKLERIARSLLQEASDVHGSEREKLLLCAYAYAA